MKLNRYILDELEHLKRIYTSEQLLKIWKDTSPKLKYTGKVIITVTPDKKLK